MSTYFPFVALFLAACYVSLRVIEEYFEGHTSLSKSERDIAKEDLPTVAICILAKEELIYNHDYKI